MSTSWRYIAPGEHGEVVEQVLTEEQIIAAYYPWWKEQMRKVGREDLINEQNCIEDWVTVHWAERVPQ